MPKPYPITRAKLVKDTTRAILLSQPTIPDARAAAEAAIAVVLDTILREALGGDSFEILSLRNKDTLKIVYDFAQLLAAAGGGWTVLLAGMEEAGRGRSEDLAPALMPQPSRPAQNLVTQNRPEPGALTGRQPAQESGSEGSQGGATEPTPSPDPSPDPKE